METINKIKKKVLKGDNRNLIIGGFLILILSLFLSVLSLQQPQDFRQRAQVITPTLFCMGGLNCISPASSTVMMPCYSAQTGGTLNYSEANYSSNNPHHHHHHGGGGGGSDDGFLALLLNLILLLLNQLLQATGGSPISIPATSTNSSLIPCPSVSPAAVVAQTTNSSISANTSLPSTSTATTTTTGTTASAILSTVPSLAATTTTTSVVTTAPATTTTSTSTSTTQPVAVVYNGPGATAADAMKSLLEGDTKQNFKVIMVGAAGEPTITAGLQTPGAKLYGQPGGDGNNSAFISSHQADVASVQNFVKGGGRYLGICMGGWLAGSSGFGVLPFDTEEVTGPTSTADQTLNINWKGTNTPLSWDGGGAWTVPAGTAGVTVLGTYPSGQAAALVAANGSGKVAVVGPYGVTTSAGQTAGLDLVDTLMQ